MTTQEQAVIDAAVNYVNIVKEVVKPGSPDYLLPVSRRRREELVKTVDRLEAANDVKL